MPTACHRIGEPMRYSVLLTAASLAAPQYHCIYTLDDLPQLLKNCARVYYQATVKLHEHDHFIKTAYFAASDPGTIIAIATREPKPLYGDEPAVNAKWSVVLH